ncbi:MAG: decaprenyl-phosphate phosphoribosyltransferase [Syntrophomonadaceae bacterium]|nr:decaprenyl-phosphate phosphoribosyltransferase [Syntrophomonadaceae bacterium]
MITGILVIIKLIRVRQWIKNLFVFAPLVFSLNLFNGGLWVNALLMFGAFSLLASAIYVFNDIVDLDKDRLHPAKKKRPLPAGLITVPRAAVVGVFCLAGAIGLSLWLNQGAIVVLLIYALLNLFYSLYGKNIILLDTMIIAIGFVLRVLAGSYAISVAPSSWMLVATFFLALLIGLGKRSNEILVMKEDSSSHRQVLSEYNEPLLQQLFAVASSSTVVSYALYTMDPHVVETFATNNLFFTLPFVVFGVFRYLYLVLRHNRGGDPTELVLRDTTMIVTLLLWFISVVIIIY